MAVTNVHGAEKNMQTPETNSSPHTMRTAHAIVECNSCLKCSVPLFCERNPFLTVFAEGEQLFGAFNYLRHSFVRYSIILMKKQRKKSSGSRFSIMDISIFANDNDDDEGLNGSETHSRFVYHAKKRLNPKWKSFIEMKRFMFLCFSLHSKWK